MSDCKFFRAEIEGAADGGVLGRKAASHVESCAACGEELRVRSALRGLVQGLGRVEAPQDFEYRLRARMQASKPGGGQGLFASWFPVSGIAWAAVAVCVLSVTATVYFKQAQPAKRGTTDSGAITSVPQVNASQTVIKSNNTGEKNAQQTNKDKNSVIGGKQVVSSGMALGRTQKVAATNRFASRQRERESIASASHGDSTRVGMIDYSVRSADVWTPQSNGGNNSTSRVQVQGIQLGTSEGTLRVALRDERGTLLPMRSVSFGSQEPLSRQAASSRTTTKDEEGIW